MARHAHPQQRSGRRQGRGIARPVAVGVVVGAVAVAVIVSLVAWAGVLAPKTQTPDAPATDATEAVDSSNTSSAVDAPAESSVSSSPDTASSAPQAAPLAGVVIAVDAGHQAKGDSKQEPIGPGARETKARVTSGTSGVVTGELESQVNLDVALKLRDELEARGATVVMVRTTQDVDISNSERAKIANDADAALFIRLHCDGVEGSPSTRGFMTLEVGQNAYTKGIVSESQRAASVMHPLIVRELGAADRGIVARSDLSGFNWCTVPTVLFEMGCMTNPDEDRALANDAYQQKIAEAIADATVAYAGAA
ncbi:MAG: N-acetylmuramoyl-L-alanine amidase [Eggerthellaceae bacterium]|nr:N-acetylmuramoyl-L-alanine amidase [Eggerthellaceae bacterium]